MEDKQSPSPESSSGFFVTTDRRIRKNKNNPYEFLRSPGKAAVVVSNQGCPEVGAPCGSTDGTVFSELC